MSRRVYAGKKEGVTSNLLQIGDASSPFASLRKALKLLATASEFENSDSKLERVGWRRVSRRCRGDGERSNARVRWSRGSFRPRMMHSLPKSDTEERPRRFVSLHTKRPFSLSLSL